MDDNTFFKALSPYIAQKNNYLKAIFRSVITLQHLPFTNFPAVRLINSDAFIDKSRLTGAGLMRAKESVIFLAERESRNKISPCPLLQSLHNACQ